MKKLFLIPIMIFALVSTTFAVTKAISETPVLIDWVFEPEVSTTMGYNLDSGIFGMTGVAKISITSDIHAKAHKEFTGEGKNYGYIKVEDLTIRVYVDGGRKDFDSQGTPASVNPLDISIGKITGKVFIGPVYIKLNNTGHEEVRYLDAGLDDGDLDFTVINYSIIPAYFTGGLYGFNTTNVYVLGTTNLITGALSPAGVSTGIVNIPLTTENIAAGTDYTVTSGPVNNAAIDNVNLGSIGLGFALPNIINIELGASTLYSFKEAVSENMNPYSLSLLVEVEALEKLKVGFKVAMTAGIGNKGVLYGANPITMGLILAGFTTYFGDLTLTPKLGFELGFLNQHKLSKDALVLGGIGTFTGLELTGTVDESNITDYVLTIPWEFAINLTLDWKSKGLDADENDHLSMAPKDVKVTDGASLGLAIGVTPTYNFRVNSFPYVAVKFALWDSEDKNKTGIIPKVQLGLIANVNFTLGGTTELKEFYNEAYRNFGSPISGTPIIGDTFTKFEYTATNRFDVGLGIEAKAPIGLITPYAGIILKMFDVGDGFSTKLNVEAVSGSDLESATNTINSNASLKKDSNLTGFVNQTDARIKLGIDLNVIANSTVTLEYLSGDLITDKDGVKRSGVFDDRNYFKNEAGILANGGIDVQNTFNTANLGIISLGVKVKM